MMLLKNIYNLSEEGVVARWMENPYMRYFTGEKVFQRRPPMNPINMTKFRKRAGIEPVIGHLKSDRRMMWNYLKVTLGDAINTLMAAAAYNMRPWMNINALTSFVSWLLALVGRHEKVIFGNENKSACPCSALATVA